MTSQAPAAAPEPPSADDTMPGTALLSGVVGSTAYGLAHASSDQDVLGVYAAPTRDVLGLRANAVCSTSVVRHDPDVTFHELGKYCALAAKANPTVLELLWLNSYHHRTELGQRLLDLRATFLSEHHVRTSYLGYARSQASRIVNRHTTAGRGESHEPLPAARIEKHARHCLRMLHQGAHLLASGELLVDVSHLREELFAAGELAVTDPTRFAHLVQQRVDLLTEVRSVLPAQADTDTINNFLIQTRLALLTP